jgi:hypothetical protein
VKEGERKRGREKEVERKKGRERKREKEKRYFLIDQQIARHLCTTVNVLTTPSFSLQIQIINPFLTYRLSANPERDKEGKKNDCSIKQGQNLS